MSATSRTPWIAVDRHLRTDGGADDSAGEMTAAATPAARRETVLEEAARLTAQDRQAVYGHPRLHHGATAAAVTAYLRRRGLLAQGAELAPGDWTVCMVLDKAMRLAGSPKHRDSVVDLAGYARCLELIQSD